MGTEEKELEEFFQKELAGILKLTELKEFPKKMELEKDEIPELERWREHE